MAIEQTLSIIKPDAVAKNVIGQIYSRFEKAGLVVVAAKMMRLDEEKSGQFYAEHKERPFYGELVAFMSSGPVIVQVLEGENAIIKNRDLMGATFPKDAQPGTIRADFCDINGDQGENAVHGSDSPESASKEIPFFFTEDEICQRSR
ncbi:MAG: nucleoside-diphosphate kinase [Gammaproteobacteria bacterium]|jgi:nucleoside-diphosphate kinase